MLLEWAALAALVAVAWSARDRRAPRYAAIVAGAILALPVLQLIPLPPALWHALPGRATEVAALDLVGAGQRWMPLSVSPGRTLAALLAALVPLALLLLTARASPRLRRDMILTTGILAVLSALFGAAELAAGGALNFYAQEHVGYLTGFQANRNAEADVLIIGLVALAASLRAGGGSLSRNSRTALLATGFALLVAAIPFTASRAGIALAVATLAPIAWWLGRRTPALTPRTRLVTAGGLALILAGFAWTLAASPLATRLAERFGDSGEPRPEIWADALYAARQYAPVGAGMGAFVPVFIAAERLEVIDRSYPNRAHNDYIELAVEAGAPGLVLLAALAAFLAWAFARRWRSADGAAARAELVFAGTTLIVLALHSVVDYPLRSMSLAALAGVAAGIILAPARKAASASPTTRSAEAGLE
jgi:O-antigen ligase